MANIISSKQASSQVGIAVTEGPGSLGIIIPSAMSFVQSLSVIEQMTICDIMEQGVGLWHHWELNN